MLPIAKRYEIVRTPMTSDDLSDYRVYIAYNEEYGQLLSFTINEYEKNVGINEGAIDLPNPVFHQLNRIPPPDELYIIVEAKNVRDGVPKRLYTLIDAYNYKYLTKYGDKQGNINIEHVLDQGFPVYQMYVNGRWLEFGRMAGSGRVPCIVGGPSNPPGPKQAKPYNRKPRKSGNIHTYKWRDD
jgi:hypothetical protein